VCVHLSEREGKKATEREKEREREGDILYTPELLEVGEQRKVIAADLSQVVVR
jgi:hypothetical protein